MPEKYAGILQKYPNVTYRKKISPEEILNGIGRNILYISEKISPDKCPRVQAKCFQHISPYFQL
jgi:hypothetical protein